MKTFSKYICIILLILTSILFTGVVVSFAQETQTQETIEPFYESFPLETSETPKASEVPDHLTPEVPKNDFQWDNYNYLKELQREHYGPVEKPHIERPIDRFLERFHKEGDGCGGVKTGIQVEPWGCRKDGTYSIGITIHPKEKRLNCSHRGTPPPPDNLPPGTKIK